MNRLALTFAALLLSALAPLAHSATISLEATLDGAQANAGNGTGSSATGTGSMLFNDLTNLFTFDIEWFDLEGDLTVAHFHGPAPRGANAGVQVDILDDSMFDVGPNSSSGSLVLTDTQAADLLAGLWYINIHSSRDPGGEIRGQVEVIPVPAAFWLFASGFLALGLRRRSSSPSGS